MPWQALNPIGIGAGAAAGNEINQQQGMQQGAFLAQLLMHAQQQATQRAQTQAYREAMMADRQQRTDIANKGRMEQIVNQIPRDTDLPSDTVQQFGDAGIGRFSPLNTLASTQTSGYQSMPGGPSGSGSGTTGEMQAQTSPSQPTGLMRKLPSDTELERDSRDRSTQAQRDFTNTMAQNRVSDQSNQAWTRIGQAADRLSQMADRGAPTVVVQTVDDAGNKVTKIVPKTAGSTFQSPQNATTENRATSAKTVLDTGNRIIQQIQQNADKLGPMMGRYNSVMDFIGDPPPEFANLAGAIESFSLANMGVHGMRSSTGAEAIKRTIGQTRMTPEAMVAAIQGLMSFANDFVKNAGMSYTSPVQAGGSGSKPSAADLIKKYGGQQP